MKTSTTIALTLAGLLSGSLAASAQTDQPAPYHRYQLHRFHEPRHTVHHRSVARHATPAARAQKPDEAVERPPSPAKSIFKPYAHPGEGDDDGLSRDPDDCMKGCIGGNPG